MRNELLCGDARELARTLPDESVHCIICSPPYFGLRDYGTAEWEGGDPDCDHRKHPVAYSEKALAKSTIGAHSNTGHAQEASYRDICGKCGATRIDKQFGLEQSPQEYVAGMVDLFRELRRALHPTGTLWLNLGDSYSGSSNSGGTGNRVDGGVPYRIEQLPPKNSGLQPKQLLGIPWRVALALQADGWYLRSDIILAKRNPMPESVTDRPTRSHEYVFLLSKSPSYYFDADAIREENSPTSHTGGQYINAWKYESIGHGSSTSQMAVGIPIPRNGRNKRTVWDVVTKGYPKAHFATFNPDWIRPMILAGTSAYGVCGAKKKRLQIKENLTIEQRERLERWLDQKGLI